jgi:endonuclease/exonuclease/phosphatase family metal-dependent hydrolase
MWPWGLRQGLANPDKEARFHKIVELIRGADVVLLQEWYGAWWDCSWQTRLVAALPDRHCHFPPRGFGMLLDSGLVIITREPVARTIWEPFQHNPGLLGLADRGIFGVVITTTQGQPLQIFNIHLHPPECFGNELVQRLQVYQLQQLINRDQPCIVGGDWNFDHPDTHEIVNDRLCMTSWTCPDGTSQHMDLPFCKHAELQNSDFFMATDDVIDPTIDTDDDEEPWPVRLLPDLVSDHFAVELNLPRGV